MKTIINNTNENKGDIRMEHERKIPLRPMPPHKRRLVHIEFDEDDWTLLKDVFGDEDTTVAEIETIMDAPPEIQILAIQLINILKGTDIEMALDFAQCFAPKFSSPALNEDAQVLYSKLYGENGEKFVEILDTSPDEIAVISRLIAYLAEKKGE